jgi:UDP-N-acetylmuramoyl-tripeptide--D-alanyl-D-alanine ligase
MSKLTAARIVTFGKCGADYTFDEVISATPGELAFTLNCRGRTLLLKTRLTGAHNCLAVSAAAACALELGIPDAIIRERVGNFEPIFGRLSVHKLESGPTFILDTVKAPYHSLPLALSVLADCVAPRKRFVLGQVSDYLGNASRRYRETYRAAIEVADQVLFAGMAAKKYRASSEDMKLGKFAAFDSIVELSKHIKQTAIPGELILVKSSRNLHLERLLLDWRVDVRCWPDVCGKGGESCIECGLYRDPFSQHQGRAAKSKKGPEPSLRAMPRARLDWARRKLEH